MDKFEFRTLYHFWAIAICICKSRDHKKIFQRYFFLYLVYLGLLIKIKVGQLYYFVSYYPYFSSYDFILSDLCKKMINFFSVIHNYILNYHKWFKLILKQWNIDESRKMPKNLFFWRLKNDLVITWKVRVIWNKLN